MPVSENELRQWTRDFYNALQSIEIESLVSRFSRTIDSQANADFRRVLGAVRDAIAEGHVLSRVMARYPEVFPEPYVIIVRYGEIYGEVDETLLRYLERPEEMQPHCRVGPFRP